MDEVIGYYAQLPCGKCASSDTGTWVSFDKKSLKAGLKVLPNARQYQMVKLTVDAFFERINAGERFRFDIKAFYSLEFFFYEEEWEALMIERVIDGNGTEFVFLYRNPLACLELTDEDEPEIIDSPLCQTYCSDGVQVRVDIYRCDDDSTWVLEVTDEQGTSLVYEEAFSTDSEAWAQFERDVKEEGIGYFIHETPVSKHLH